MDRDSKLGYYQDMKPGDVIIFGSYPQTTRSTEKTPIEWRVLNNSGCELFVLSEYILDCKRYHRAFIDTYWSECDLRKWLNDDFYNMAFNLEEQSVIRTSHCTDNGDGRPDTKDKVFLLSVSEARELTGKLGDNRLSVKRRAIGTQFSKMKKSDGCKLYAYDKTRKEDYVSENGEELGCSWWWLRTQPHDSSRAFFIGTRSSIRSYGRVNLACYGVRPSLKLNCQPQNNPRLLGK